MFNIGWQRISFIQMYVRCQLIKVRFVCRYNNQAIRFGILFLFEGQKLALIHTKQNTYVVPQINIILNLTAFTL